MEIRLSLGGRNHLSLQRGKRFRRHWDGGCSPAAYHGYRKAKGVGQIVTLRALTGIWEPACLARGRYRLTALIERSLSCVRLTVSLRDHTLKRVELGGWGSD